MERGTGNTGKTEPASSLGTNVNEDTCVVDSCSPGDGDCGTTDVARARWSLLRQVESALKASTLPLWLQTQSQQLILTFMMQQSTELAKCLFCCTTALRVNDRLSTQTVTLLLFV